MVYNPHRFPAQVGAANQRRIKEANLERIPAENAQAQKQAIDRALKEKLDNFEPVLQELLEDAAKYLVDSGCPPSGKGQVSPRIGQKINLTDLLKGTRAQSKDVWYLSLGKIYGNLNTPTSNEYYKQSGQIYRGFAFDETGTWYLATGDAKTGVPILMDRDTLEAEGAYWTKPGEAGTNWKYRWLTLTNQNGNLQTSTPSNEIQKDPLAFWEHYVADFVEATVRSSQNPATPPPTPQNDFRSYI